eukprot:CAMPEP_0115849338 /NCGR_PEP_ID=MMETSP0287-20121206/11397_1 /TAXON_ID=412157 /ORGANISM="Chrysochromulina rotalis, Strain UIO044" /LENGTH=111 /DNA_ID=CAMNT_0003303301 /DNA_START=249 /DNA_END=581 /DNA_ORIENTATION=-
MSPHMSDNTAQKQSSSAEPCARWLANLDEHIYVGAQLGVSQAELDLEVRELQAGMRSEWAQLCRQLVGVIVACAYHLQWLAHPWGAAPSRWHRRARCRVVHPLRFAHARDG